jgi:hypothetical protein
VLGLTAALPAVAQQSAAPSPVAAVTTGSAAGPRVQSELRPVQASFADTREPIMYHKKETRIVISTLVLVLCVVILVLLIA